MPSSRGASRAPPPPNTARAPVSTAASQTARTRRHRFASPRAVLALALAALLAVAACLVPTSHAVKFDLVAEHQPTVTCIWNYALTDTLVIVTLNVKTNSALSGTPSAADAEQQRVDVEIVDGSKHNNIYLSKKNIRGETRMALHTHSTADLGVCVKNTLLGKPGNVPKSSVIDLDVDIGAEAVDYNAVANQESLSALEVEMKKLDAIAEEIVQQQEYMKAREVKMRSTNESTNSRVEKFSMLTLVALLLLGVWQTWFIRNAMRKKRLID